MRELDECKAEVFRRSETRIKERKRVQKRVLSFSVPLLLFAAVGSAALLPSMLSSNDCETQTDSIRESKTEITADSADENGALVRIEVFSAGGAEEEDSPRTYVMKLDNRNMSAVFDTVQDYFHADDDESAETGGQHGIKYECVENEISDSLPGTAAPPSNVGASGCFDLPGGDETNVRPRPTVPQGNGHGTHEENETDDDSDSTGISVDPTFPGNSGCLPPTAAPGASVNPGKPDGIGDITDGTNTDGTVYVIHFTLENGEQIDYSFDGVKLIETATGREKMLNEEQRTELLKLLGEIIAFN